VERDAVLVVAGLIWRQGRLLICRRSLHDAFPGKWEFPGGKVEAGEEPRAALMRELDEELGISARIGGEAATIEHQYPGRRPVRLLFFHVCEFTGTPVNRVFEEIRWVEPPGLSGYDFLAGDLPLIERLTNGRNAGSDPAA
jgi:8-oxo-dGTP diphosphatase